MSDPQSAKEETAKSAEPEIDPQQLWKLLVELGPLLVFFIVNSRTRTFPP